MQAALDVETIKHLRLIRSAASVLKTSPLAVRNKALSEVRGALAKNQDEILNANASDVARATGKQNSAFLDRLRLDPKRISGMQASLADVIGLPDPIGEVEEKKTLPNGLLLKRVRSPLGVILMIFEARPNVITEALSIALKSGNALIMRGGSDSIETSRVLYRIIRESLASAGLPVDVFWGIENTDRAFVQALMKADKLIDILVPRGGDSLIEYVVQNATIPIIKNDRGLCHVYVHEDADDTMAVKIIENAKVQRPGVCNSMETLLIHEKKKQLLVRVHEQLSHAGVQFFGCPETLRVLSGKSNVSAASDANYDTEYLDLKMSVRVVNGLQQALEHIELHGSRHSESIITANEKIAREFQNSVDAAAVYWNASTRFTDGYQMGLGGELGISTQKLHVRGPVGPRELTSLRWIVDGTGQIRE